MTGILAGNFFALNACVGERLPAEPIKAFCIDFNWGPGGPNAFPAPGHWADASPEEHIAWYAGLGCNVVQTFAVSCNGYAWYKGGKVPEQPGMKYDFLPQMVKLGHAKGMKVMGYFCIGANTRWGTEHPELSYGAPSAIHIPLTSAYLAYLAGAMEEALRLSAMDGFMIDWVFNPAGATRWLPCEQTMYAELMGEPFPGREKITPDRDLAYRRKALERCWETIHATAKRVKPDCVIWLSCHNTASPEVANSKMFREVDWLMNENTDASALAAVNAMKGPATRLVQCMAGWGGAHDTRSLYETSAANGYGFYGFARPTVGSLLRSIADYRQQPVLSFQGNDRNIAVLVRAYNSLPMDEVTEQDADGGFTLRPERFNASGKSPVCMEGQIGHWGNAADRVYWQLNVTKAGRFAVEIEYAVEKGMGGSTFAVLVGDQRFERVSEDTGGWRKYKTFPLGEVKLDKPGRVTIEPSIRTPWRAISVRAIRLRPSPAG